MTIQIQPPRETDLDALVRIGEFFWSKTLYARRVPYDYTSVLNIVKVCIEQDLFLVAYDGDKIAGFIGGLASPLYANNDVLIGQELFFWVQPEYRNDGVGSMLLDAIEKQAKDVGIVYWSMMYLVNIEPEKAKHLYTSRGYFETEIGFTKEV